MSTLRDELIRCLLIDVSREIGAPEKLCAILNTPLSAPVHQQALRELYLACGCFEEALNLCAEQRHFRKMGDIAWASGDLEKAETYYLIERAEAPTRVGDSEWDFMPAPGAVRNGPDWDRLIKLSFVRERWADVLRFFLQAPFVPLGAVEKYLEGLLNGQIQLGGSAASMKVYIDVAAIALVKLGQADPAVTMKLRTTFGLSSTDLEGVLARASGLSEAKLRSLRQRSAPRLGRGKPKTVDEVLVLGATPLANKVLDCLVRADEIRDDAAKCLRAFLRTGDEDALTRFVTLVTELGVATLSEVMIRASVEKAELSGVLTLAADVWSDNSGIEVPVNQGRLIRLYRSHPIMRHRPFFGHLITLKLRNRVPLSGSDLVDGLFAHLAMEGGVFDSVRVITAELAKATPASDLALDRQQLLSARDWAELRCEDWLHSEASQSMKDLFDAWENGRVRLLGWSDRQHAEYRLQPPTDAMESREWHVFLRTCLIWLTARWKEEIGVERWKSEARFYQLVKRAFEGLEVVRGARPVWLAPQHLDIYIPELSLGIEYMGRQHYEPIAFFGGESGFRATIERDRAKETICKACGVTLIRVRYDEDIRQITRTLKGQFYPGRC